MVGIGISERKRWLVRLRRGIGLRLNLRGICVQRLVGFGLNQWQRDILVRIFGGFGRRVYPSGDYGRWPDRAFRPRSHFSGFVAGGD